MHCVLFKNPKSRNSPERFQIDLRKRDKFCEISFELVVSPANLF